MSRDIVTTVYGEKRNLLPYLKCYGFGAPVPGPRGDFAKLQTGGLVIWEQLLLDGHYLPGPRNFGHRFSTSSEKRL